MQTIRIATIKDKDSFRHLWDLSFNDTIRFRDWFFENRFFAEYSICIEEDNKIVSAVQSAPCFIKIRDSIVPATIMVGACTHPDYKKKGYMKKLYTWYMEYIKTLGVTVCAHTPAVIQTYFNVGHFPVSDTGFIEVEKSNYCQEMKVVPLDLQKETASLLKCYNQMAKKYSGIIIRTISDMGLKCNDYMADGAKCIAFKENGTPKAYGIYYENSEFVYGEEIVALDSAFLREIVYALLSLGNGKKVKIKLPPDTQRIPNVETLSILPRNVLGLTSVSALLLTVGKDLDFAVEITDSAIPDNNGTFNLRGEKTSTAPVFKTEAGHFLQWIVGYKSIQELAVDGFVEIFDQESAKKLDFLFPKQICHIIDEY